MGSEKLTGDEKFDPAMQDRLAIALIKNRVKGTVEAMQRGFSGIWDSIPAVAGGNTSAAGHRTTIGSNEVVTALRHLGAAPSANERYASADPPRAANNNHSETHINGPITIHTPHDKAKGIADDMHFALRGSFAGQANTGLA